MALTPEQFKALEAMRLRSGQDTYYDPTSGYQMLAMRGDQQSGGHIENGDFVADPITGYRATQGVAGNGQDRTWLNGRTYDNLDTSGNVTGQGMWQGLTPDGAGDDLKQIMKAAAVMAAVYGGGTFLQGGGFGGAGAAGPGDAGWGMDLGGAGAADTSYMANIGGASGGMGGGSMGVGGSTAGATGGMLGSAAPAGGMGSSAAGGLGSLGSLGGMLGPAATALGGLLGAQGNKAESNSQRTMDPRLDPYVYGAQGQQGLLQDGQALKDRQMTPEAQAGYLAMQRQGQGLLNQPIAGNGFQQFANRRLM